MAFTIQVLSTHFPIALAELLDASNSDYSRAHIVIWPLNYSQHRAKSLPVVAAYFLVIVLSISLTFHPTIH
jgi:hypothetical protein